MKCVCQQKDTESGCVEVQQVFVASVTLGGLKVSVEYSQGSND